MGLSRKYARLSAVLTGVGVAALIAGFLPFIPVTPAAGLGLFIGLMVSSTVLQLLYLRCPYCRKGIISTRTSRKGSTLCPQCGKQIRWKD